MMSSASEKIGKLRTLAEHPDTPLEEAESAWRRIEEIKNRLRTDTVGADQRTHVRCSDQIPTPMSDAMSSMLNRVKYRRGASSMRTHYRYIEPDEDFNVHDEWPLRWEGARKAAEYETGWSGNGYLSVGWKCPDCGDHVVKILTDRFVARCRRRMGMEVDDYVKKMTGGEMNQLCNECWGKWE